MSPEHKKYTPEEIREISKRGLDAAIKLKGDPNDPQVKRAKFLNWAGLNENAPEDQVQAVAETAKQLADICRKRHGIPESIDDVDCISYDNLKSKIESAIEDEKNKSK